MMDFELAERQGWSASIGDDFDHDIRGCLFHYCQVSFLDHMYLKCFWLDLLLELDLELLNC